LNGGRCGSRYRGRFCSYLLLPAWNVNASRRFFHGRRAFLPHRSCTTVDAFFGSIRLLWAVKDSVARNLALFAIYLVSVSAVNLLRLIFGVYSLPLWRLITAGHEVTGGFFHFSVFLWLAHWRNWHHYLAGRMVEQGL
jgi:hypothetical protein